MKISKKKSVKASEFIDQPLANPCAEGECVVIEEQPACKYQCAIDLISSAIECLAEVAKDDPIAKDSIANLGVVMLDLKSEC